VLQSWTGPFVPEPPHSPFYRSHAYKAPFNVTGTGAVETIVLPMTGERASHNLCFLFETAYCCRFGSDGFWTAMMELSFVLTAYTSSYSTFTGECTDHSAVCWYVVGTIHFSSVLWSPLF